MVRTGEWLSAAWRLVTSDIGNFVLLALIDIALLGASHLIPWIGGLILGGPVSVAVFAVVLHKVRTGRFDYNKLEVGIRQFVPALLAGLLVSIFTGIGFTLLIIPGFIVMAWYLFPFLLIADGRQEFWNAMEESRLLVSRDLWGFVGFVLALIGINILGAIALGIGLLVSIPVSWVAVTIAYRELWPEPAPPVEPGPPTTTPGPPPPLP